MINYVLWSFLDCQIDGEKFAILLHGLTTAFLFCLITVIHSITPGVVLHWVDMDWLVKLLALKGVVTSAYFTGGVLFFVWRAL